MSAVLLPDDFADLEQFSDWVLATQPERYNKRLASSMQVMQTFYDTMFPRLPAAIDYCQKFSLDDMPAEARHLMRLIFSLIEVSFPVECWSQARVPDSGSCTIDCVRERVI